VRYQGTGYSKGRRQGSDDSWRNRRGVNGASVQLHTGAEGRPSVVGGVAWPSIGGGRRPGWAGVGLSAVGPMVDGAGFGESQKKMEAGCTREWAEIKE
jgi:hypothetical protein